MAMKLALALVMALAATTATFAAEYCAAPANTLHFDCQKLCGNRLVPCMKSSSSCEIECFPLALRTDVIGKNIKINSLTFLVTFGNTSVTPPPSTAKSGNASNSSSPSATISVTSLYASKSNDAIQRIEQIMAPANVTVVSLRGGASPNDTVKGQVANVALADNFLGKSRQILSLSLENFNLSSAVKPLLDWIATSKLETLSLSNGLLTTFPEKALKISKLRDLDLSYNDIASVNESIAKSMTLQTLDLTGNAFTEVLSAKTFPKLKTLRLGENGITTVPASSARVGLIELSLNENKISKYDVTNRDLIFLDLASNALTEVPTTIGFHKKLKNLRLSKNKISSFPSNISISTLETLELTHNELTSFDNKFSSLVKLDLSNNKFTKFPPVIFTMSKLKNLLIANNSIADITFTKDQATFLQKLESLAIDTKYISLDCNADRQYKIHGFTYCVTDNAPAAASATPKPKSHHHKHKSHHKHKHHYAEPPTVAPTVTDAPALINPDETTTSTVLAAADANESSNDALIMALSSIAGAFVAAVAIALVVKLVRKTRRSSADATEAATATDDDKDVAEPNAEDNIQDGASESSDDDGNAFGVVSV